MGTSAKRYGIEVKGNLELERRLRGIETAIAQLQPANVDASNVGSARGPVPQVTGLRVTGSTPGATAIAWNAVSIADLRRYELELATTAGFSADLQETNVAGTTYSFSSASATGGGGGVTWYARVRAVNSIQQNGPWSATLNLTTGQAQTSDLGDESVTGDKLEADSASEVINEATIATIKLSEGLRGHLGGLFISRASASTITVSAGSTTRLYEQLETAMTKSTAGEWVSGDGNNGMGDGLSVGNSIWYHVFLIKNDTTLAHDVGFDTSITAVNLLTTATDYLRYRRVGSFLTDGSAQIVAFTQVNDEFTWAEVFDQGAGNPNNNPTTVTLTGVPLNVSTRAILNVFLNESNGFLRINFYSLDGDSRAPDSESGRANMAGGRDDGNPGAHDAEQFQIRTNTSKQVGYHSHDASSTDWEIGVAGYIDDGLRGAVAADTN